MSKFNSIIQSLQQEMHEYLSGSGVYENVASTSDGSERAKLKAFHVRVNDDLLALLLALSQNIKAGDHVEDHEPLSFKTTRGKKRAATAKTSSVGRNPSLDTKDGCQSRQEYDIKIQEVRNGTSFRSEGTELTQQQLHEGSDDRLLLKPLAKGNDEGTEGVGMEQKKRSKRAEKWTEQETDVLLEEFVKKPKNAGRFDGDLPLWTLMSKELKKLGYERTGDQCRQRIDRLKKSYTAISKYCNYHIKEFTQLQEDDYQKMKLSKPATRWKEKRFVLIRNGCPPKSKAKKNLAKQGFSRKINIISASSLSGSPSAGMMEASSSTDASHEGHIALDVGIGTTPLEVPMIQGDLTGELESLSSPWNQLGDIRDFGELGDEEDFNDFLSCLEFPNF